MPRWIGTLLIVSTIFALPLATVIAPGQNATSEPASIVVDPVPAAAEPEAVATVG